MIPEIFDKVITKDLNNYIIISVLNKHIFDNYDYKVTDLKLLRQLETYLYFKDIDYQIHKINDQIFIKGIKMHQDKLEISKNISMSNQNIFKGLLLLLLGFILLISYSFKNNSNSKPNRIETVVYKPKDNTTNSSNIFKLKYLSFNKNDIYYISKYSIIGFTLYIFQKIFLKSNNTKILNVQDKPNNIKSMDVNELYNKTPNTLSVLNQKAQDTPITPKELFKHQRDKSGPS